MPSKKTQLDKDVGRVFENLSAAALSNGAVAATDYGSRQANARARRAALRRLDVAAREYYRVMMLASKG